MGSFRNDAIHAFRVFWRNPGFSAITVIVLAVGIGAAAAIFTVFSALMLRPLPLPHPEQLVELSGVYRNHSRIVISYPMFSELRRQQTSFTDICGWSGGANVNVEINGSPLFAKVRYVTGNYYSVLGVRPFLGRLIAEDDEQGSTSKPVAVVSYEFWNRRLGRDLHAIGRALNVEGKLFTVIGVTPKWTTGMTVGDSPDIMAPTAAGYDHVSRALLWVNATGRLRDGVSVDQARAQVQSFWPRLLEDTVPTQSVGPRRQSFLSMGLRLESASTGVGVEIREKSHKPLYLLMAMVGLILLVVCINLASLTLARASARRREVSTRIALGATPWQAVRQSMIESMILATTGATAGLALAYWGSQILVALMSRGAESPMVLDLRPDWRVLLFCAFSAILTGALIGLVPAWKLSREQPLVASQRTVSGGVGKLGKALIVSQIAISLVLLHGAGLFLRSLQELHNFNPGFEKNNLTEMDLAPQPHAGNQSEPPTYRRELAEAVASLPGVESASFSKLPIPARDNGWKETVAAESDTSATDAVTATLNEIAPNFFRTLAVSFLAGRDFTWEDDAKHPKVAIIDGILARQLFPNTSPIGKRIRFGVQPEYQSIEIVGVAQSARLIDIRDGSAAVLYVPAAQYRGFAAVGSLMVRDKASVALDKDIEDQLLPLGREYVVSAQTFTEKNDETLVYEQMTAKLSSFFAALALLVASAGLFGLMSYSVTLRTREIGIRMALGSQRGGILELVLREALLLTVIGIGVGIPCALIVGHFVARMLFELSPTDLLTLAAASITLLAAGLSAGYLPARKAMKLDPMVALRQD
ncbi:MAG TPA: ABC transporter permease [Acidobacteriaceae bacterium]|nr:ABC transporter permease [Acidobacteriaceae bacterium]